MFQHLLSQNQLINLFEPGEPRERKLVDGLEGCEEV